MAETGQEPWSACHGPDRDRRNQRLILLWSLGWMVLWLGVNAAITFGWLPAGSPSTILLALVSILPGVGTVLAYRTFLRQADELRRKIELDALALAFGVGVVFSLGYVVLQRAGAVAEVDVGVAVAVMLFTYSIGVVVGRWRYA